MRANSRTERGRLEGRVGFGPTTSRSKGERDATAIAQAWMVGEIVGSYLV
jgi:hypothetical protein